MPPEPMPPEPMPPEPMPPEPSRAAARPRRFGAPEGERSRPRNCLRRVVHNPGTRGNPGTGGDEQGGQQQPEPADDPG
jgi:hypothetical protein